MVLVARLKDGALFKQCYRGIKKIGFIWNGTQSDPEVAYEYKGKFYAINYWDVDEELYYMFTADYPEYDGKDVPDEILNDYAVKNGDRVCCYLEEIIDNDDGNAKVIPDYKRYDLVVTEE